MKKVFIVGMVGYGNLGDDLISYMISEKVNSYYRELNEEVEIGILIGNEKSEFTYRNNITLFNIPRKNDYKNYFKNKKRIKRFIKKSDILVIGGGGLFQDVHSPFTPYKWTKYINYTSKKTKIITLGVGIGEFRRSWPKNYFKFVSNSMDLVQVRDELSTNYIPKHKNLLVDSDIVEGSKSIIHNLVDINDIEKCGEKKVLGCSIRPWKGLTLESVSQLIINELNNNKLKHVKLFVFEDSSISREEYKFNLSIKKHLEEKDIKCEILVYGEYGIKKIMTEMANVDRAIAVRLHANIIWQLLNISVLPISYSQKVKEFYRNYEYEVMEVEGFVVKKLDLPYIKISNLQTYEIPELNEIKKNKNSTQFYATKLLINFVGIIAFIYRISKRIRKLM